MTPPTRSRATSSSTSSPPCGSTIGLQTVVVNVTVDDVLDDDGERRASYADGAEVRQRFSEPGRAACHARSRRTAALTSRVGHARWGMTVTLGCGSDWPGVDLRALLGIEPAQAGDEASRYPRRGRDDALG